MTKQKWFAIWAQITSENGDAACWFKVNGDVLLFDTLAAAQTEAERIAKAMNERGAKAAWTYTAKPFAPDPANTLPMLRQMAEKWGERQTALGLKGKAADKAVFEFMLGAMTALRAAGHPEASHVETCVALILATVPYPCGTVAAWAAGMTGRDAFPSKAKR